ncbi:MAG: putative rane protein [Herbinix sp.]|jgi:YYY domain-containing protein|nr:putative rane protein [Herbinix sp.]
MKKVTYSILAIILLLVGKWMLQGDYISFLQWWAAVAGIGIIFIPVTTMLFASFHDKGYLFSKAIGIAVTGYLMWLFSSLHLMKFTTASSIICIMISLILNGIVMFWQYKKRTEPVDYAAIFSRGGVLDTVILEELMFFAVFLLFTYIRCFKPEAYGTEKFMDYGFMTSLLRSDYMPPQDFWFSGTKLNYYYVGQYIAAYLTRITFVEVSAAYNLMLMMVGAFTVVLPYSIIYNVTRRYLHHQEKKRYLPAISGVLAGAGVCIAGNMHYPVFKWLEPAARIFFGIEAREKGYWFPDATRYIGYHPETSDKTIHEFPAYSFVLGDLHAHVINIFFVLTVIGLLFAWLSGRDSIKEQKPTVIKEIFHPAIIALTFFIGLFHTTNFWDFPIYFVVSGGIILFSNLVVYNFRGKAYWLTGLQGIFVYLGSSLVCLPFTLNFDQISTNICLTVARTPLHQMIILWGLPVFVVICFVGSLISNHGRKRVNKGEDRDTSLEDKDTKAEHKVRQPVILHFFATMEASDLYILILGLCAIGLIIIPEVIYVEDIYSGDYKRANTMFKLTYQAFIMFGLCFGYILPRLLCYGRTLRQRWLAGIGLALFLVSLTYCQNAVNAWYGNIFDRSGYEGLDAAAFMANTMPDDNRAIQWLNENLTGTPVVLEANGDSYSDYQRVSVMTGFLTPLGWRSHEWLWKGDTTLLDTRAADIESIYNSLDEEQVKVLIKKYHISYLYVGKLEQDKYKTINHELLKKLGTVVFSSPITQDKSYETYIVQINY